MATPGEWLKIDLIHLRTVDTRTTAVTSHTDKKSQRLLYVASGHSEHYVTIDRNGSEAVSRLWPLSAQITANLSEPNPKPYEIRQLEADRQPHRKPRYVRAEHIPAHQSRASDDDVIRAGVQFQPRAYRRQPVKAQYAALVAQEF